MRVVFQSVSKWETGTTTPDVALLPELARYFGITLDDLFSITNDDHLARIDSMLRDDFLITQIARRVAQEGICVDESDVRFHRMYLLTCKDRATSIC